MTLLHLLEKPGISLEQAPRRSTIIFEDKRIQKLRHYEQNAHVLTLIPYEHTYLYIDKQRTGLNKLHLGNLISALPHLESSQPDNHDRIDLQEVDELFAKQRLGELERWQDPAHLNSLRDFYIDHLTSYFAQPRLEQLTITPKHLEEQLAAQHAHITQLAGQTAAAALAYNISAATDAALTLASTHQPPATNRQASDTLLCLYLKEITTDLRTLIDYVLDRHTTDPATYWDRAAVWGDD